MTSILKPVLFTLGIALAYNGSALAASQTRTSAFEYDATTGLLVKEIIEPDTPNLCLVTTYTYDAYGNRASATTANCTGASGDAVFTSRTSSNSFAATSANLAGYFPTTSTNALSQSEAKEYDARFGGPTKLTGPNALTTTWTYDGFGRKASESRADGTSTTWTFSACGTCPTNGKYLLTETSTGAPVKKLYYDSLNREIRSEVQGFDGTAVLKDTQYNSLGQVTQVSKPYYTGATPVWTTFTYDVIGRVTQTDDPAVSGIGMARTTNAYAGLVSSVTISNAGGTSNMPGGVTQTRTTTRNSQGQVVDVTNLAGSIAYTYDPFGNLTQTDAGGVVTSLSYDLRGRKTGMTDPDMGSWTYAYNALGELIRQVDAKSQTTTMAYDLLGRMITRTEPDLTSTWTFDSCTKGVGKLCSAAAGSYSRTQGYDSLGRPSNLSVTVDTSYSVTTTYDSSSRVDTITYPTSFETKNLYNSYGYLEKVQDTAGTPTIFWQATAQNAAGQVTSETLGNGLNSARTYDTLFRLTAAIATDGTAVPYSQTFAYDVPGNLTQRVDTVQSVTENFTHDGLNRLTQVAGPSITTRSFSYNAIGNVTYKSDVGSYTYPSTSSARPHTVSSVSGSAAAYSVTATYGYDANGNLTSTSGTLYPATGSVTFSRTLTHMSFNAPDVMTHVQGGSTYSYTYTYNGEHERVKLVTVRPSDTLTSIYLHPAGKGALLYEKETRASDGRIEHKHYVTATPGLVGVYVTKSAYDSGDGPQMRYYHRDHLGSIAVITNPAGAVLERLAYEAFGERRYPSGAPEDRASPIVGVTTDRGFTAHEHLDEMMLIHMNGRVYDPVIARFMTPDPVLQDSASLQNFNRYSYVLNNPLAYTDPTGYKFKLGSLLSVAVTIAVAYFAPPVLAALSGEVIAVGTLESVVISGAISGVVSGGGIEGALKGAVTAGLFYGAGEVLEAAKVANGTIEAAAVHAVAGCISGVAAGSSCGAGALSAGFAEFAGLRLSAPELGTAGNAVVHAVLGGTAAVAGGGKFANGAVTGAFGYLFNHCSHGGCTTQLEQALYDWMPGYKAGTLLYNQTMGDGSWTGWEVLDAASVGAGVAGRGLQALQALRAGTVGVEFGANANQVSHAFRHIDAVGLPRDAVMTAIRADIPALQVGQGVTRSVTVNGTELTYRANRISEGVVNVGRITPPRP